MEMLGEIYTSVVSFWEIPLFGFSIVMAILYMILAARNVARKYIDTGEIPTWNGDPQSTAWDEIKTPHVVFGFFGAFLLAVIPSFLLAIWPLSAFLLILAGVVIIPVQRQRKKVMFMQALKGEPRD